jgi:hypothetical protein
VISLSGSRRAPASGRRRGGLRQPEVATPRCLCVCVCAWLNVRWCLVCARPRVRRRAMCVRPPCASARLGSMRRRGPTAASIGVTNQECSDGAATQGVQRWCRRTQGVQQWRRRTGALLCVTVPPAEYCNECDWARPPPGRGGVPCATKHTCARARAQACDTHVARRWRSKRGAFNCK